MLRNVNIPSVSNISPSENPKETSLPKDVVVTSKIESISENLISLSAESTSSFARISRLLEKQNEMLEQSNRLNLERLKLEQKRFELEKRRMTHSSHIDDSPMMNQTETDDSPPDQTDMSTKTDKDTVNK